MKRCRVVKVVNGHIFRCVDRGQHQWHDWRSVRVGGVEATPWLVVLYVACWLLPVVVGVLVAVLS